MIQLLTAKCTIAFSVYSVERKFAKTRWRAIRSALQAFIPQ